MPVKSDDPLRRVTLNLYEADCGTLCSYFGHGWTEHVRLLINLECRRIMKERKERKPKDARTLGDLHE